MGGGSTRCSPKLWSWCATPAWESWGSWQWTRRPSRRTTASSGWTRGRGYGRSGRNIGGRCGTGRSNAMRRARRWQPSMRPSSCSGCSSAWPSCRSVCKALKKSGEARLPRTDGEARVLRKRGRSVIGYTAELAVSEDHMIVAQRVTQQKADNDSLLPMLAEVQRQCGAPPQTVLADAGYYKNANLRQLEAEKIDAYIPDSNMAAALNRGRRVRR